MSHQPVLLQEAIQGLNIKPNGIYIDATFGRGGHSKKILELLGLDGRLIAVDQDPEAVAIANDRFSQNKSFQIVHDTFAAMEHIAEQQGVMGLVNGIIFDLGVSSPQLDDAKRGFSFLRDGPLDMRMDNSKGMSARDWLEIVDEEKLIQVLKEYGEEKFARRICRAILTARDEGQINTTKQLADIVVAAVPKKEKHKHPATRTFQAIRIYINKELEAIELALEQCIRVLCPGGRMAVISFHSLEDRVVKRFMKEKAKGKALPKGLPVMDGQVELGKQLKLIGKAVKATDQEVAENIRARSAVLRISEKLA